MEAKLLFVLFDILGKISKAILTPKSLNALKLHT